MPKLNSNLPEDAAALHDIKMEGFNNINKKILKTTKIFDTVEEEDEAINNILEKYL